MDETNHEEVYRRVFEAVNRGDEAALDDLIAEDVFDHNPISGQEPGIAGFKQWLCFAHAVFSDVEITVEDVVSQGDRAAGRVTWRGVHEGSLAGVAGTGRPVQFTAIQIVRFENGKTAEWWGVADLLGALLQVGARIEPPAEA